MKYVYSLIILAVSLSQFVAEAKPLKDYIGKGKGINNMTVKAFPRAGKASWENVELTRIEAIRKSDGETPENPFARADVADFQLAVSTRNNTSTSITSVGSGRVDQIISDALKKLEKQSEEKNPVVGEVREAVRDVVDSLGQEAQTLNEMLLSNSVVINLIGQGPHVPGWETPTAQNNYVKFMHTTAAVKREVNSSLTKATKASGRQLLENKEGIKDPSLTQIKQELEKINRNCRLKAA